MFEVFANQIGMQLDNEKRQWSTEAMLTRERETAALREPIIAVPGHDLRNPLSAVNATAELLIRRESEPDLVTAGQRLRRTATRMDGLINDLMDFARGRLGGGILLSVQTVDALDTHLLAVVDELRIANPSRTILCDIVIASRRHAHGTFKYSARHSVHRSHALNVAKRSAQERLLMQTYACRPPKQKQARTNPPMPHSPALTHRNPAYTY